MRRSTPSQAPRYQRGLTLVELMVSLALGLFLAGVVTWTYLQSASGTRFGALESQMNEEGALALELVRTQLRLAGYSGKGPDGTRIFKELAVRGCDGGFTAATATGDFDKLDCNGGSGNDAIALQYQATELNAHVMTSSGEPANCVNAGIADSPIAAGVQAAIADNRYFVAPDPTNDGVPSLYCRGSDGPGSFSNAAALVPNVESLQLRYAITRAPTLDEPPPHQVTAIVTAANLADNAAWARVAAVELCLIMRSAQPVPRDGLSMAEVTRHIDCNGNVANANDGRLRRAYRTLVPLPNMRPAIPRGYQTDAAGVVSNPYIDVFADQ